MKEIVFISGKGGTGKTSLLGAIASTAENKIIADCDVDVPDLHYLFKPIATETEKFSAGLYPYKNDSKCINCGKCKEVCKFGAISSEYQIDLKYCEGCSFCYNVCPNNAIEMKPNESGELYISKTNTGTMIHAKLNTAEDNSGKLVSLVKKRAKELAKKDNIDFILIDGSPGIGCPVISSITGADCAIVITEPTLSGLHDAKRIIKVAKHFKVPVKMIINKFNLNKNITSRIEKYCIKHKIKIIGKIRFDKKIIKALINCKTITEYRPYNRTSKQIKKIWNKLKEI